MRRYIIDSVTDDIAVCECGDGSFVKVSVHSLPPDAREGDLLTEEGGVFAVDKEGTKRRRGDIQALLDELCD